MSHMRRYTGRRLPHTSLRRASVGALLSTLVLVAGVSPAAAGNGHGPKVDKRLADEVDKDLAKGGGSVHVIAYGSDAQTTLANAGAKHVKQLALVGAASGEVPASAVDGIAAQAGVSSVTVDAPVIPTALGDALVPLYPTVDAAPTSWASGFDGSGVGVAVLDRGMP